MDFPNTSIVTIKTEPGTREGNGSEIPYMDIDIDHLNIKEECLENHERIAPTAGKNIYFTRNITLHCKKIK